MRNKVIIIMGIVISMNLTGCNITEASNSNDVIEVMAEISEESTVVVEEETTTEESSIAETTETTESTETEEDTTTNNQDIVDNEEGEDDKTEEDKVEVKQETEKQEEVKQEEVKAEEVKQEAPKVETPKQEAPKQEEVSTEDIIVPDDIVIEIKEITPEAPENPAPTTNNDVIIHPDGNITFTNRFGKVVTTTSNDESKNDSEVHFDPNFYDPDLVGGDFGE